MTMNELELRQEICRVGRSLFERGYIHSTAGNISVRLPDGFLIETAGGRHLIVFAQEPHQGSIVGASIIPL